MKKKTELLNYLLNICYWALFSLCAFMFSRFRFSFTCSLDYKLTSERADKFTRSLVNSFTCSLVHSFIRPLKQTRTLAQLGKNNLARLSLRHGCALGGERQ